MTRSFLILALLFGTDTVFSQASTVEKNDHVNLPAYLIELEQISGKDSIVHRDSIYRFQVTIPKWWHIRETPPNVFGGTFPAVDSIENALIFKCFKKDEFKDLPDFENWVIKDYSIGQSPNWSAQHKILLKKELEDFKYLGNAYKVQMLWGGKIYDCCFILVETTAAYIWIDFTATNTTYDKNFARFKQIISLFKPL